MTRWLLGFGRARAPLSLTIRVLLSVLFVGMVLYYVLPRKQAFSVFASTEYLAVDMVSNNAPDWELPSVQACIRKTDPVATGVDVLGCDPTRYEHYEMSEAFVRWSEGYRLVFQGIEPHAILVTIERDETAKSVILDGFSMHPEPGGQNQAQTPEITHGSILRIPITPQSRPLMPIRGRVTIGDVPNGTQGLILHNARYEIRQQLGLNRRPAVVAQGVFFPGDRIGFASEPHPYLRPFSGLFGVPTAAAPDVVASLFITDISRLTPAFDLVATTPPKFSSLRLTRIGSDPTIIPVTWTQRVVGDSIPVAVATLLGLLGTTMALTNAYLNAPQKKPHTPTNSPRHKKIMVPRRKRPDRNKT